MFPCEERSKEGTASAFALSFNFDAPVYPLHSIGSSSLASLCTRMSPLSFRKLHFSSHRKMLLTFISSVNPKVASFDPLVMQAFPGWGFIRFRIERWNTSDCPNSSSKSPAARHWLFFSFHNSKQVLHSKYTVLFFPQSKPSRVVKENQILYSNFSLCSTLLKNYSGIIVLIIFRFFPE